MRNASPSAPHRTSEDGLVPPGCPTPATENDPIGTNVLSLNAVIWSYMPNEPDELRMNARPTVESDATGPAAGKVPRRLPEVPSSTPPDVRYKRPTAPGIPLPENLQDVPQIGRASCRERA